MLAERIGSLQLASLAADGSCIDEQVSVRQLPRLHEALAKSGGDQALAVQVRLSRGGAGLVVLDIAVTGALPLICQRCLQPVSWDIDFEVTLSAVRSEERAEELPDPFDSILLDAEGGLALATAVEDEILSQLPLVPLHETAECAAGQQATAADSGTSEVTRPFAALGILMNRGGDDDR